MLGRAPGLVTAQRSLDVLGGGKNKSSTVLAVIVQAAVVLHRSSSMTTLGRAQLCPGLPVGPNGLEV